MERVRVCLVMVVLATGVCHASDIAIISPPPSTANSSLLRLVQSNVSTSLGAFLRGGNNPYVAAVWISEQNHLPAPNNDWVQPPGQPQAALALHPSSGVTGLVGSDDSTRTWFEFSGPFCTEPGWQPVRLTSKVSIAPTCNESETQSAMASARISTDIVHRRLADFSPICHHDDNGSSAGYCLNAYPYWKVEAPYSHSDSSDAYCKAGQPSCLRQHPQNTNTWSWYSFSLDEVCPMGFTPTRLEDILFMPKYSACGDGLQAQVQLDQTPVLSPAIRTMVPDATVTVNVDIAPGTQTVSFGVHQGPNGDYTCDHLMHVNPTVVCQRLATSVSQSRFVQGGRQGRSISMKIDPKTEFIAFSTHAAGSFHCDWAQFEHPVITCQSPAELSGVDEFFDAMFLAVHNDLSARFNATFACRTPVTPSNMARWCALRSTF